MESKLEKFVHLEELNNLLVSISNATNSCFQLFRMDHTPITKLSHRKFCQSLREYENSLCDRSEKTIVKVDTIIKKDPSMYECLVAGLHCFKIPINIQGDLDSYLLGGEFIIKNKSSNNGIPSLQEKLSNVGFSKAKVQELIKEYKKIPKITSEDFQSIYNLAITISEYLRIAVESKVELQYSLDKMNKAEQKAKSHANYLETLHTACQKLIDSEDLKSSLEDVVNIAAKAIGVERCSIWLFNKQKTALILFATTHPDNRSIGDEFYFKGDGLTWSITESIDPIRLERCADSKYWKAKFTKYEHKELWEAGGGPFLGIKLTNKDSCLGAIKFGRHKPENFDKFFSKDDETFGLVLASIISNAINNFITYHDSLDKYRVLGEINRTISESEEIKTISATIFVKLKKLIDFKSALIFYWNELINKLEVLDSTGYDRDFLRRKKFKFAPGEGITGKVYELGKPRNIGDVSKHSDKALINSIGEDTPLVSYLGVPLSYKDEIKGVIVMTSPEKYFFNDTDLELLSLIANQVAITIGRSEIIKQLESEEEFLKSAIKDNVRAIVIIDMKGQIVNINSAALKILKYKQEEIIQQDIRNIYLDKNTPNKIIRRLRQESIIENLPVQVICGDGDIISVVLSASLIRNKKGDEIGTIGLFKHALDFQVEKFDSLFSSLVTISANIAHHLHNPLSSIKTYSKKLNKRIHEDNYTPEKFKEYLRYIEQLSQNSINIITEFIDSTDLRICKKEVINLSDVILRAKKKIFQTTGRFLLDLHNCKKYSIFARAKEIELVFINLFENSLKYTDRQVKVDVEVIEILDNYIEINYKNNGREIPKNIWYQIFEPLFTTSDVTKGLGLFLCYKIIKTHEGFIYLKHSDREKTIFTIRMPKNSKIL